ncbi:MAG: phosphoribosyltransferase [Verrucomicrobia bacterium]|nr:phosphoribosyltransferase [Verrucomicrobiota bacterium]
MIERFRDRREAGRWLANTMDHLTDQANVVLALPRGGVPVGLEVAHRLHAPLQVFVVRKLGVPGHEEYAMGAIASGGVTLLNEEVIRQLRISRSEVEFVIARENRELERREQLYSGEQPQVDISRGTVILVDDGLATGSTMKAAVRAVRQRGADRIVVAVPVAPASAREEFEAIADEFICVLEPELFYAVGQWYENFSQTTDDEVRELLAAQNQVVSGSSF